MLVASSQLDSTARDRIPYLAAAIEGHLDQPKTAGNWIDRFWNLPQRDRWAYAAAGCLLLVYFSLTWYLRIPAVTTGNDDATYLHLARAVSHFNYRELWIVGEPVHSQYPPFYPIILAAVGFFSGYRLDALLVVNHLLVVAALCLMFDAVRRLWSPALALLMLAMLVVNPGLVLLGGRIMSEAPYLALSCLVLWIPTRTSTDRTWVGVAFCAAAILAALTRSVGITLLAAVFVLWALDRRWRALGAFALASSILVGSWLTMTALAPHEVHGALSYVADAVRSPADHGMLFTLLRRLTTRVPAYLTQVVPWELPLPVTASTVLDNVLWVLLLVGLGGLGLVSTWRRWRILPLYLGTYGGLLALWTWVVGRFLAPILPLIVIALLAGTDVIRRRYGARLGTVLAVGLAAVVVFTGVRADWHEIHAVRGCDRKTPLESPGCFDADQRSLFAASRFVEANTPDSAVVVTAKDAVFAYYSGRRVVRPRAILAADSAVFVARLAESGADYVFLGSTVGIERGPYSHALWRGCTAVDLVDSFPPRSFLFRPATAVAHDTTSAACRALSEYRSEVRDSRNEDSPP